MKITALELWKYSGHAEEHSQTIVEVSPEDYPFEDKDVALGRMSLGRKCFVLYHNNIPATRCWATLGDAFVVEHIGEIDASIVLPQGEAYIWDCRTIPEFRGLGLYTQMLKELTAVLSRESATIWVAVTQSNMASKRGIASANFQWWDTILYLETSHKNFALRYPIHTMGVPVFLFNPETISMNRGT